ncbi:Cna B-type domain-containing protein, partial [Peptostreptococcus canis]
KEGNAKTGFTITNKNIEKISIPVEKKWEGEELDSVRVRLFADGKEVTYKDLNKANNWRWTFDNRDKYNEQGQEIKYTVKEDKIEG